MKEKSSYQRLKKRLENAHRYSDTVEKIFRGIIVDLLVLQHKDTGKIRMPLFGQGIGGDDLITHIDDGIAIELIQEAHNIVGEK